MQKALSLEQKLSQLGFNLTISSLQEEHERQRSEVTEACLAK